jgi:hypothetical protein
MIVWNHGTIGVGGNIQNLDIRFIYGACVVHGSLQSLQSCLLLSSILNILSLVSIRSGREVAQITQIRLGLEHGLLVGWPRCCVEEGLAVRVPRSCLG